MEHESDYCDGVAVYKPCDGMLRRQAKMDEYRVDDHCKEQKPENSIPNQEEEPIHDCRDKAKKAYNGEEPEQRGALGLKLAQLRCRTLNDRERRQ